MHEAVFWTVYLVLMLLGTVTFVVSTSFLVEFYELRLEKAVSNRMPQIIAFQLIISTVPFVFDGITIPLYHLGFEHVFSKWLYLFVRVVYVTTFITAKITRIWCFNWKYALTRHEMERLWKNEMQVTESKSWAVRYAAVFSKWRRALLFWFLVTAVVFFTCTLVVPYGFTQTHSRAAISIGAAVSFLFLYVPAFWALYRTKDCHDIYGIRNQLLLEVYLVAALFVGGVAMMPAPTLSPLHRFLALALYIVFWSAYFFATTRYQLWKIEHPSAGCSLKNCLCTRAEEKSRATDTPPVALTLKRLLADYSGFELLAEHCLREMTLNHLFFVVAYMRLKEYLFRFLKAEDLYEFESGAEFENTDDGAMLQNMDRPKSASAIVKVFETMPLVGRSSKKSRRRPPRPPRAEESAAVTESTLSLASIRAQNVSKVKHSVEMGRVVALPTKVLQPQSGDYSLQGCVRRFSELFDRYVDFEGDYCVNIASAVRQNALNCLRSLTAANCPTEELQCLWECVGACDRVLVDVMQNIKYDSFSRFMRTPQYNKWMDSVWQSTSD